VEEERQFPIQGGSSWKKDRDYRPVEHYKTSYIPWWLAEEAYEYYSSKCGTVQSLERLAERGGFSREDLLIFLRRSL